MLQFFYITHNAIWFKYNPLRTLEQHTCLSTGVDYVWASRSMLPMFMANCMLESIYI